MTTGNTITDKMNALRCTEAPQGVPLFSCFCDCSLPLTLHIVRR